MWRLLRCPASQVQGTAFPFWLFRDLSRNTGLSAPFSMNTDLCFHSLLLRFQPPTLRDSFVILGKKAFVIPWLYLAFSQGDRLQDTIGIISHFLFYHAFLFLLVNELSTDPTIWLDRGKKGEIQSGGGNLYFKSIILPFTTNYFLLRIMLNNLALTYRMLKCLLVFLNKTQKFKHISSDFSNRADSLC